MTRLSQLNLTPNTPYAVQVRAVRDGQYSEWSERYLFSTVFNSSIPAAPATVTWTVQGDGFLATWTEVTQDISGGAATIDSYELELVAGATTKVIIVPAQKGQSGQWSLDFQGNIALFGTPQASINLRVRAVNNKGIKGNWSGSINAANPAPANVAGFTGTAVQNGVDLTWTANTDTDLDHYDIFVGTTSGFTATTGNRIFSGNITHFLYTSTTYSAQYFKIRAVDKFGTGSLVDTQAGPYTPTSPFVVDVTAPNTPTSLAGTIVNNANGVGASATLTWVMASPPSDLSGYNIRYRPVGGTAYQYMNGIDSGVLTAIVLYLQAYTNYEFQIQAYDLSSNKSAWSSTLTVTSPTNATPAVPTGLTSVAGNNSITYSWANSDTDIANYEVTFSTSPTFASGNTTFLTGTAKTLTVGGLSYATTYYARVRSNDTGGLSSAFSGTDTKATGAAPGTSDGLVPTSSPTPTVAGALGYLFVSWTPISNADPVTYEVHVSTSTGFTPSGATKAAEVSANYASLENDGAGAALAYGTTYFVKLIAKDRDGAAAAGSQASGAISQVAVADVGAGAITTNALAANAVTANKLSVVMGGGNLLANTNSGITTGHNAQAGASVSTDATVAGAWPGSTSTVKVLLATTAFSGMQRQLTNLLPSTTYTWSTWVKLPAANTPTGGVRLAISGAGVTSPPADTDTTTTGVWIRKSLTFTTNATATPVNLVIMRNASSGVATEFFNMDAEQFELGDVPTGYAPRADEILPGTIVTNMLVANAITANELSASAFTGKTFTVGASGFIASSNYVASTTGWRIGTTGIEMNDAGSSIKADSIKAGTIGGTSGAGIIDVAFNTSLRLNGGNLRSNTYDGTYVVTGGTTPGTYWAAVPPSNGSTVNGGTVSGSTQPTAGFYLGNDGLVIKQGAVSAAAITTGTLGAQTITVGAGGSIVGGTWTLSSTGLSIPNGGVSAAALNIQIGSNVFNPQYADFDANPLSYPTSWPVNNATSFTVALSTAQSKYNSTSLLLTNTAGAGRQVFFGQTNTDYNFPVDPSTLYYISMWVYNASAPTAPAFSVSIKDQTGASTSSGLASLPATTGWFRQAFQVTTGASASKGLLSVTLNNTSTVYIDGIQVEAKTTSASTPSPWSPPASTTINGGLITTGSIRSTGIAQVIKTEPIYDSQGNLLYYGNPTLVNDPDSRPAWAVSTTGAAEFSNLLVTGNTVLGPPTTVNTTVGKNIIVNFTSGSPTMVGFPGAFQLTDVGLAVTHANLPGGTTIIAYVNSNTVTLSANATASATGTTAVIFRPAHYVSQIASSGYVQGTSGWLIRSDGYAEFRQLAAESIQGAAIKAGSVDVNRLKAGTMTATVALAGSITAANSTTITLTTTAASTTATSSDAVFTAADVGLTLVGANIPDGTKVATFTNSTTVTLSKAAITTGTDSAAYIYRGRQVTMDPTGISLIDATGKPIIILPTNSDPAQFNGKVNSGSLSVEDYLQMTGTHNAVLPDSSFNLSSGTYVPSTYPSVTFTWNSNILTDTDGTLWSPKSITNENRGFYYDPTDNLYVYVATDDDGGMGIYRFSPSTFKLVGAAFISSSLVGYGTALSVTSDATNYYFMYRDENNNTTKMATIVRSQITNGYVSSFAATSTWTNPITSTYPDRAAISLYAGNIYVAVAWLKTGTVTLEKYTGITVASGSRAFSSSLGSIGNNNSVTSIQVGKFDMGGTNIYAAVNTNNKSTGVMMYQVGGSSFTVTSANFPSPTNASTPPGTTWVAATVDTSSGHFETLGSGGTVYVHTGLAAATTANLVYVRQYWKNSTANAGAGGISSPSQVYPTAFVKRSIMNFTSAVAIPNIGGNSPDSLAFAASVTSGTTGFWRYAEPAIGATTAAYTAVLTADAAGITTGAMVAGAPASIKWGAGRNVAGFDSGASGTLTTNASSQTSVSHALGVTPVTVMITPTGSSGQMQRVVAKSSTSFTVEHRTVAGALVGTGVSVAYDWIALS